MCRTLSRILPLVSALIRSSYKWRTAYFRIVHRIGRLIRYRARTRSISYGHSSLLANTELGPIHNLRLVYWYGKLGRVNTGEVLRGSFRLGVNFPDSHERKVSEKVYFDPDSSLLLGLAPTTEQSAGALSQGNRMSQAVQPHRD